MVPRVRAPEGACKVLVPQFVCGVGAFFMPICQKPGNPGWERVPGVGGRIC